MDSVFSRVLRDSTTRFVGPSVRPSVRPSIRPSVRPSVRPYDNEDHRLNHCRKWQDTNFISESVKVNFRDVYSEDKEKLAVVIQRIQNVWELKLGNGSMKKPTSLTSLFIFT